MAKEGWSFVVIAGRFGVTFGTSERSILFPLLLICVFASITIILSCTEVEEVLNVPFLPMILLYLIMALFIKYWETVMVLSSNAPSLA